MPIESGANYIGDLNALYPPSGDPVSQGDDHIRLIKTVLQNSFPTMERAFPIPTTTAVSSSATVLKTQTGVIYVATTGGAVTLTLPTLAAVDQGWRTDIVKTSSDVNPIFIKQAAGNVNSGGISVAQARRCIPGIRSTAIWDGTNWFITRVQPLPIGSLVSFFGTTLPAGYEWPSGQTLSSAANYPEFNAVTGSLLTPDFRGRTEITLDNLGGTAAGRLPSGWISGSTLGAVGGTDNSQLATANLPAYTPAGGVSVSASVNWGNGATGGGPTAINPTGSGSPVQYGGTGAGAQLALPGVTASGSFTGTPQGGTSNSFSNLQPSIMCGKVMVVE